MNFILFPSPDSCPLQRRREKTGVGVAIGTGWQRRSWLLAHQGALLLPFTAAFWLVSELVPPGSK